MNRTLPLVFTMALALVAPALHAQTAPAASPASAAPTAVPPQPVPAKVAVIAFEQAVVATNEGQRAVSEIQKKYEPQKNKIDSEAAEVQSLQKQVQALPANTSDEERANRLKVIDTKEKQLQRDSEDAQNSYNNDLQEAYGRVAQKVGQSAVKYAQDNGFTMVMNVGGSQQAPNPVLWFAPTTDITQAVINAYNVSSGVAPPPPSAPSHTRRPAAPASTTPKK